MNVKPLVIGIGNPYRSDDRAGLIVLEKLKAQNLIDIELMEAMGEGAVLIDIWKDREHVIVVDAVDSGARPGTVYRFDVRQERIPSKFFRYSTHAFSLAEAVELARSLERLPERLIVFGIEGKNFKAGTSVSPEISRAAEEVADRILRDIRAYVPER